MERSVETPQDGFLHVVCFRYHMFLSSLSKTALELGLDQAAQDFSIALGK